MTIYGPQWPLSIGEKDLFRMNQTKNDQDLFELRNLLLTNPGENLSNPDYGGGLRRFIFEQNTSSALGEIELLISDQISRFGPALNILSINVISTSDMIDRNAIGVKISYRSLRDNQVRNVVINTFSEAERLL